MSKITQQQIEAAYTAAKRVYAMDANKRNNAKKDATRNLFANHAMAEATARIYIEGFILMMEGKVFVQNFKISAVDYFLKQILQDYGIAYYANAIRAVKLHIERGRADAPKEGSMPGFREIVGEHEKELEKLGDQPITPKTAQVFVSHADEIAHEVTEEKFLREGEKTQVTVTLRKRNNQARQQCIAKFGTKCSVCDLDFEAVYGEIGKGFIHVHHLNPIAQSDGERDVNWEDLIPVCPNCHAMLHKQNPPLAPNKLRTMMTNASHAHRFR